VKIDTALMTPNLNEVPAIARQAEAMGFDALWMAETSHNPFLPLAIAAEHTTRIELGTAIAIAFARSPMVLANIGWDLAAQSGGRFIMGLGTQVKAHNERRFSVTWESPGPKLREVILSLRAIWDCWQDGTRLNFRGQFYTFTLMSPFFNPGPIEHPDIPIYIAGVNRYLCRLAGELCQGFHVHPLHTVKYLQEVTLPSVEQGLAKSGRTRSDIELSSAVFVITGANEDEMAAAREQVRAQVAFYASTPSYRPVMEIHGWGETGQRLSAMAARRKWAEMPMLITDAMLEHFAVTGSYDEIAQQAKARYEGLLDRVTFYVPFRPGMDEDRWRSIIRIFHE